MRTEITPGHTSDHPGFDLVMAENFPDPGVLLADRGYDVDRIRKNMDARDVRPVIPMRKSGAKRISLDRLLYRLRNLVELVRPVPRTGGVHRLTQQAQERPTRRNQGVAENLLENCNLPGDLKPRIAALVEHYSPRRWFERLQNPTLADVCSRRGQTNLKQGERNKRNTTETRRLAHREAAERSNQTDAPDPFVAQAAICPKIGDDRQAPSLGWRTGSRPLDIRETVF